MVPSLYLHIPFCEVKCGYCDFFSVPRGHGNFDLQCQYVDQLIREIQTRSPEFSGPVQTIFFGGGTPSLLEPRLMESILKELSRYFSWTNETEITMEANPKTVSRERLVAFRSLGINRLSIGVQSFQDKFLKAMGRIHSGDEAAKTVADAFQAGFDNVSVDLIYALPDQSFAEFLQDLTCALSLGTQHLSAYNLTIEAGTPFQALYDQGKLSTPSDEAQLRMFEELRTVADRSELAPYEISNFSRPGYECRHNLNYWNYGEWLGFGAGAVSFFPHPAFGHPLPPRGEGNKESVYGFRRQNIRNLKKYLEGNWEDQTEEILTQTAMSEFLMMGLRKEKGIFRKEFENRFGQSIETVYGKILDSLLREEWLEDREGRYRLSRRAVPVANEVIKRFF